MGAASPNKKKLRPKPSPIVLIGQEQTCVTDMQFTEGFTFSKDLGSFSELTKELDELSFCFNVTASS